METAFEYVAALPLGTRAHSWGLAKAAGTKARAGCRPWSCARVLPATV